MYIYDKYDIFLIKKRVKQYKNQIQRRISNLLKEDEFRILRLQNGIYIQKYAYMLRIAIPYGLLSSNQLRKLSYIINKYDRNYGHFTTRQNIQLNWINLKNSYLILKELSKVNMHSIQTSGNCIRNITSDEFSNFSIDEIYNSNSYAEIIREWSIFHPEFSYLPRKFKISIYSSFKNRIANNIHDIGLKIIKKINGKIGFSIFIGGGLGRNPLLNIIICKFLSYKYILSYLESILRIYNLYGKRDNIYKARIKILVKFLGKKKIFNLIKKEWLYIKNNYLILKNKEINKILFFFKKKKYIYNILDNNYKYKKKNKKFNFWLKYNTKNNIFINHHLVVISLKDYFYSPGDITSKKINIISDLCDDYNISNIYINHRQNIIFSNVPKNLLFNLWKILNKYNLSNSNINLITDIICCPGGDFCSLANTKSINIFKNINKIFKNKNYQNKIGNLELNISGCINSCGHHHVSNIGILGVNKNNNDYYQISIGGDKIKNNNIGKILGPSLSKKNILLKIKKIIKFYINNRINKNELFLNFINRINIINLKKIIY